MDKMKILILSWRCLKNPASGGSELYFHEMAKRWVKWGHEVVWFSPAFPGCLKEEVHDGIKIIRRGGRFSVYLRAFLSYLKELDKDFDVVIDVENGIPFFSPLYIRNGKVVLHIHHIHKEVWFKEFKFPLSQIGYLLEMKFMPLVYKNKKVITISESSVEEIIKEGMTKFKLAVVNPGIEFYKTRRFAKNKKPAILFLNRIKKYKGIGILLKAVNELKKRKSKDIEFWIAGSGDYLEEMKTYAKDRGLKNVKFFGRISENKKAELMQRAWLFANPSFKEGWGIVNIEANYFGTPVIGSNVGGIRDSVIDGKTGVLFEYGNYKELADKISSLVKDKKKLSIMQKNGKKWSKKFSWDTKAKEYIDILKKQS